MTKTIASQFVHRRRRSVISAKSKASVASLALIAAMAIYGATLAPDTYLRIVLAARYAGPDSSHWLGRDELGRDTLSRLLAGATTTLGETFTVIAIALCAGFLLHRLRYVGPRSDKAIVLLVRVCFVAPEFLLGLSRAGIIAMAVLSVVPLLPGYLSTMLAAVYLGPGPAGCVVALGSFYAVAVAHMLAAAREPLALLRAGPALFAWAILSVSTLDAIGLGTLPPRPSWGAMIGDLNALSSLHRSEILALGCLLTAAIAAIVLAAPEGSAE